MQTETSAASLNSSSSDYSCLRLLRLLISKYFRFTVSASNPKYMLLHMQVPWHPVLPPQTASPWWSGVMSKRATAQSAASSLAHIYKPNPVAAHCVKPSRLAEPCAWQELKERVVEDRRSYRPSPNQHPIMNSRLLWERGHPCYYRAGQTVS